MTNPDTGEEVQATSVDPETGDVVPLTEQEIGAQDINFTSVFWKDPIFPAVRNFKEATWCARRFYFTREQLRR